MSDKLQKIFLINLLFAICFVNWGFGYHIYWANLHSHTELSDGQGTVTEAYRYARDSAQIDILAITDHTHYLTENGYQYTRNLANQFTEDGRFVALAGQEFGSLGAFGHFSLFEAERLYPYSVNGLEIFYNWIYDNKVIAQFNHPRTNDFNNLAYNHNGAQYATMFEVVNGSGTYTPYYEELYIKALNNGWHIAPVANQDNHNRRWGNATTTQGQIPLTAICADSLTKSAILQAMLNKQVYAVEVKPANDRIYLWDFSIGNTKMGSVYYTQDNSLTIKLIVQALNKFSKIYLYKNGVITDSVITDTNYLNLTFTDNVTNGYYFIKGIQQDGDRFWTAPIWVNYHVASTNIEAWPNPIRSSSQIRYPQTDNVVSSEMKIYTIEGKEVFHQKLTYPDIHHWNGTNQQGISLENSVYLVVIKVKTEQGTKVYKGKVALLK